MTESQSGQAQTGGDAANRGQANVTPASRSNPLRPVLFLMVVFFGVAAVVAVSKYRTPPELVQWKSDLPAAMQESRSGGKPVLAYFTAEWCGPCQTMRRYVWTDPEVAAAMKAYLPVRIDIDRQTALAQKFQVETIPMFIVLDPQGQPIRRIDRAMESAETIQFLRGDK